MPASIRHDPTTAFLNLPLGGVGLKAISVFQERYAADGKSFPQTTAHLDTDPNTADHLDQAIRLSLGPGQLDALRAYPERFGPAVKTILREFDALLDPEEVTHGARTIRAITQLAFEFFEPMITRALRKAIHTLVDGSRVQSIKPVFISSSGGGTGSALQILLAGKFADPHYRRHLTEGLPEGILGKAIAFVADPYALAQLHQPNHHAKIMGNSFAFRIESEHLERRHAYKWIFHVGLANRFGTVLSDPEQIAWVLGSCLYEMERNWSELMGRSTDPAGGALTSRYLGRDVPEVVLGLAHGNGHQGAKR